MNISPNLSSSTPPARLWPDGAPGALGPEASDIPSIKLYFPHPEKATGAAVLVCPGGGYNYLADHEGEAYAKWLAANGMMGILLTYRLTANGYRHPAMMQDAMRGIRYIRSKAHELGINRGRIGIIGSSAGGHLASMLMTHIDQGNPCDPDPIERESSRPDFGILCYPAITMRKGSDRHMVCRTDIAGPNPDDDLISFLSTDEHVTEQTPPCFIWHTWEDGVVKVENAIAFADALNRSGVRFELHVYEKGGHGLGLGKETPHRWTLDCLSWLREYGYSSND